MKRFTSSCSFPRRCLTLRASFAVIAAIASLCAAGVALADTLAQAVPGVGDQTGIVQRDRSNVRTRPSKTSEVIAQLDKGASVTIVGRQSVTEGDTTMEWLQIRLPASAKCYVNAKFVSGDTVNADAVNVRCGPGTNYKDVGKLAKGERVEVVATEGEWIQIKPTPHCSGWIAAELVEVQATLPVEPVITTEVITPPVAVPVEPVPAASAVRIVDVEPDVRVQYVVKTGVFSAVQDPAGAPAAYELLTPEVERRQYRICYLDTTETNPGRYEGKQVRVHGNERWRKGDRYPVLVVERIDIVW